MVKSADALTGAVPPSDSSVQAKQEGGDKGKKQRGKKLKTTPKVKRITAEDCRKIELSVKKAVADGTMTEEQGKAKLVATRARMAAQKKEPQGGEKGQERRKRGAGKNVQKRVDGLLAWADKNKDGAVTQAEAGDRWARLSSVDANKDGKVTSSEMHSAWSEKEEGAPKADNSVQQRVDGVLARSDKNKDGVITQAEAGAFWARISNADANKDGKVTGPEMKKAWSTKEPARGKTDLEARIKRVQASVKSGRLTAEQGKARIEAIKKGASGEDAKGAGKKKRGPAGKDPKNADKKNKKRR